jgi:uncharacterized membrane protein YgcG
LYKNVHAELFLATNSGIDYCIFLVGSIWVMHSPPALAYDNPELLPNKPTPVVDLAKTLTDIQEEQLVQDLNEFQAETGWKLRVLTQYDRTQVGQ